MSDDPAGLVAFVKRVFGATGDHHDERPAEFTIDDSIIMVSGTAPATVAASRVAAKLAPAEPS